MQQVGAILPFVIIALLFWLLIIRPTSRRQRELRALQDSLTVGDRVVLTSGFHGTLRGLGEDTVEVEIAPGTVVTVARGAIGSTVTEREPHDDETGPDQQSTDPNDQADPAEEN